MANLVYENFRPALLRCLLAVAVTVAAAVPVWANCSAGEVKIRMGSYFDVAHFARHRASNLLRDAINSEFQGKACFTILNDVEKFKGAAGISALQAGDIDILAPDFSSLQNLVPEYEVFDLPFAFRDLPAVEKFQTVIGARLFDKLSLTGLQPLSFWHGEYKQLASKSALYVPALVAGKKFTTDDMPKFREFVDLLKSTTQTIAGNERLAAIESQRVDIIVNGWRGLEGDKSGKAMGQVTETNHRFIGYQLLTSKLFWQQQELSLRRQLLELIRRISRQVNFEASNRTTTSRNNLMRAKVKILPLTRKQRGEWRRALSPLWTPLEAEEFAPVMKALNDANSGL